jgi:predicted Rossmann-fold nucleotide-binding protein
MAAMNQGAHDHNGRIVGVIHEMFVVDGSDWLEGSHSVFTNGEKNELLIAKGDNLQERKRLLVDGADALIVLPGGPGTWDEV